MLTLLFLVLFVVAAYFVIRGLFRLFTGPSSTADLRDDGPNWSQPVITRRSYEPESYTPVVVPVVVPVYESTPNYSAPESTPSYSSDPTPSSDSGGGGDTGSFGGGDVGGGGSSSDY